VGKWINPKTNGVFWHFNIIEDEFVNSRGL
jgi:hypothetical protein